MEIIGYLFVCILNLFFSGACLGWFLIGGFELGNIFTSKEPVEIAACLFCCFLNIYFWTLLISSSPFMVIVK